MNYPDGAKLAWVKGLLAERDNRLPGSGWRLLAWESKTGEGTPLLYAANGPFFWAFWSGQQPRAVSPEALSVSWCERVFDDPTLLNQLSGVFALFLVDRLHGRLLVAGDRLGVQAIHYMSDRCGTLRISTHLMWLLLASGHEGEVNRDGFLDFLTFGFAVATTRQVFSGVARLEPGAALTVAPNSSETKEVPFFQLPAQTQDFKPENLTLLADALRRGVTTNLGRGPCCIGLTAGKDSLGIASAMLGDGPLLGGTFGSAESADRLQAKELSKVLGWEHLESDHCNASEFPAWVDHIAFHSAGLATCAYADMARFIGSAMVPGCCYIMGEAGEAVREHFHAEGAQRLAIFASDRTTPAAILAPSVAKWARPLLSHYPEQPCHALRAIERPPSESLSANWIRMHWMPFNASLRHSVLSPLRPKGSPYLDVGFMDLTYALKADYYIGNRIHRRLIEWRTPTLVRYYDAPAQRTVTTQDWVARFPNGLGRVVVERLAEGLGGCGDLLDRDGILRIGAQACVEPSREVWFLLRVLSFVVARSLLRQRGGEKATSLAKEVLEIGFETRSALESVG